MALRFYVAKTNDEYIPNTLSTQKTNSRTEAEKWQKEKVKEGMKNRPDTLESDWLAKYPITVDSVGLAIRNELLEKYGSKYLYTEDETKD